MDVNAIAFLDFDHSLLETTNTDVILFEKLLPSILDEKSEEDEYRVQGDWNGLMNMRFQKLGQSNIPKEAIIKVYEECLLTEPAINYLKLFYENNVPVHIISDSNTLFISTILKASGVEHMITEIHTNPHTFVGNQLSIGQYHHDSTCVIASCPRNICKGRAVKDILRKLPNEPKIKIYVGDGGNDYCPVKTTFNSHDIVFARKNYTLLRKLRNDQEIQATVVEWEKAGEILSYLLTNTFCPPSSSSPSSSSSSSTTSSFSSGQVTPKEEVIAKEVANLEETEIFGITDISTLTEAVVCTV